MPEQNPDNLLTSAVDQVLETMFFTASPGPATPFGANEPNLLGATLSFHGTPSGNMAISISNDGALQLAAAFLGVEESSLHGSQVGEVICELANMLCGSVLSNFESERSFDLSTPKFILGGIEDKRSGRSKAQGFALETGALNVYLEFEDAA
jgi:CheY-specific phosphatase CheX